MTGHFRCAPSRGEALAAAAEALAGARFRLHGRDPATGLDCLGVLATALAAIGRCADLPQGYALRARALPVLDGYLAACNLAEAEGAARPGDVLLTRIEPCQFHLLVAVSDGRFVHAHAGARRVLIQPGPPPGTVVHHWRLAETD